MPVPSRDEFTLHDNDVQLSPPGPLGVHAAVDMCANSFIHWWLCDIKWGLL